jgi:hypothetical protein
MPKQIVRALFSLSAFSLFVFGLGMFPNSVLTYSDAKMGKFLTSRQR